MIVLLVVLGLALPITTLADDLPTWHQTQETDALRGTSYQRFTLTGRFLTPPQRSSIPEPILVAECAPGQHRAGSHLVKNGKHLKSYLAVGSVLGANSELRVELRLDDGKVQTDWWSYSTDMSAAFFPATAFNNLLYGHMLPHKENTSPAVHKVVVAIGEFLGGRIVMQFDMPDPTSVADACGVVIHKQ